MAVCAGERLEELVVLVEHADHHGGVALVVHAFNRVQAKVDDQAVNFAEAMPDTCLVEVIGVDASTGQTMEYRGTLWQTWHRVLARRDGAHPLIGL